jgi:hypothetical protein
MRLLGLLYLCALVFPLFCPLFGQERVIQRVTAPITAPLQSVFSHPPRIVPAPQPPSNNALPGLGTLSAYTHAPTAPPVFAGSLEFLPPDADQAINMIPALLSRSIETTGATTLSIPSEKFAEAIVVSAQTGWHKRIGTHEVYFLRGDCLLRQGATTAYAAEAVVWIAAERNEITGLREVTLYLESDSAQKPVQIVQAHPQQGAAKITDQKWVGHWYTGSVVDITITTPSPTQEEPAILRRAIALMTRQPDEGIVQTQFTSPTATANPALGNSALGKLPEGFRRVEINSRGDGGFNTTWQAYDPKDSTRGGIVVLTGGVNLIVEGITEGVVDSKILSGDTIDISADNVVAWTQNPSNIIGGGSSFIESDKNDFELYLEGNIIYRDGERVIEASKMYYDVKHKIAYILNGHLSTPISEISSMEGTVRLKADILRQTGNGLFTAKNAMVTTSQLGEPTYSLRSQSLRFDRRLTQSFDGSEPRIRQVLVAENNYIALRNFPVFYWPWMATDVEVPTFYLKNISYGNSGRNGHTIKTRWDPFQILNLRRPDGVDGDVNVSWMSRRGLGHGAEFQYVTPAFFHVPGQAKGTFDYWAVYDRGTDHLGGKRDEVGFPHKYRYRLHWVHQQRLETLGPFAGGPWDFRAEVGKVSDRNFMNSNFNSLWHSEENATTAVDLKRRIGNQTFTISSEYALDNFYTNANWLPRLDHYWIGESLLNDYLTWYEHTRIGLVDYRIAKAPTDPLDIATSYPLPWEWDKRGEGTGLAFSTRHELDLPIQAGAVKVVPYVLGDFSVWGKDQTGSATDRLYGQSGVRLNLPIWSVNPRIGSRTWYLNGLAHKIDLNAEYMYGKANHRMDDLILTDALDQWSIDDFRRRYLVTNQYFSTPSAMLQPHKFDPRYYALRSGLASNVTAGNMEIADDMQMFRLGMIQRFQTKRGSVGNRHILDWITFSTHVNLYPQSQHNFGENVGLIDYNVLWHVGDRFSLFSEGLYDVFKDGQNLTRFGGVWNRPDRGSFSLTLDQLSGIVERTYLSLGVGYTMNEKYSMSYQTSYDLRQGQNVGHNFMFVRTGESFRMLVGAAYSEALSEWSFSVGLEPVFLRRGKRATGVY